MTMKLDLKKDISMPRIPRPKLGRPSIPGRGREINAPRSNRGPDVKVPDFARDIYADLRDRHLLPLVLILLVAIVVAPIALGGKGGGDATVSVPPIASGATANSSFQVVPAPSKLTTSRRLAGRRPLNPFRQETTGSSVSSEPKKSAKQTASTPEASRTENPSSSSSSETVESSAVTEVPAPEPTPVESLPPGGAGPAEGKTTKETTNTESKRETTVPKEPLYVANLKVGFDTETPQTLAEVEPMTKLPDKKPALLYVGLTQDHQRALLLMTSEVTAYYGAAHCALDKEACALVELQPGKSATFEIGLGEDATRYKVFLESIETVTADKKSATETTKTETTKTQGNAQDRAIGGELPLQ